MTARENQLYELGRTLGIAQGIDQAAQHFDAALTTVRAWPAVAVKATACEQLATRAGQIKVVRREAPEREAVVNGLLELGKRTLADHGELVNWLESARQQLLGRAQEHRAQFVQGLAGIDTGPASGPHGARARAKTIGGRVLQRVAKKLHEALDDD